MGRWSGGVGQVEVSPVLDVHLLNLSVEQEILFQGPHIDGNQDRGPKVLLGRGEG